MIRLILFYLLVSTTILFSQNDDTKDLENYSVHAIYPEGVYLSQKDFENKTPDTSLEIIKKDFGKNRTDNIIVPPSFFYKNRNKRIKKVFAISHKDTLYFQIKTILQNRNKDDKAQDSNFKSGFAEVLIAGENYLYMEAPLVNKWKYAVALNVEGNALETVGNKGIVWDQEAKEFNIFRSCKDYNDFIASKVLDAEQECVSGIVDLKSVKEAIFIIK